MNLIAIAAATMALSAVMIVLAFPLMRRYALARPNARSSHRVPTPQGGGAAVILSVLLVISAVAALRFADAPTHADLGALVAGIILIAVIGAWDDMSPLPVFPRLAGQAVAAGLMVLALPDGARLLPGLLPAEAETVLLTVAAIWFVNLTNFIDGIDGITTVNVVSICLGLLALHAWAGVGADVAVGAAALAGAMAGFAPFNRPPARLFLGDVGSLPIGLLVAWLLYRAGAEIGPVPALILALYPCADATVTLVTRLMKGERIWEAHRSHAYQRAVDAGMPVTQVLLRIAALNGFLAVTSLLVAISDGLAVGAIGLALAGGATALMLRHLHRSNS